MRKSQTTQLDELMMDIIHIHSSLWSYKNSDEDNIRFIKELKNIQVTKWFIESFVKKDRSSSLKHMIEVSESVVGMWAQSVSYCLTEEEIFEKIQEIAPLWQKYINKNNAVK